MNYKEAMEYLDGTEVFGSKLGLASISRLTGLLDGPQTGMRFVHVAGTNGKGSVSVFIGSILSAAGFKTGVFTSPHLERFSERITVNGDEITMEEAASVCQAVKEKADIMAKDGSGQPTHFEIVTAMALLHFKRTGCDFAVLEVGLGGRLDATNVIAAPEAAVITTIGRDHTDVLGGTLSEIAHEKAGIIKPHCDVITCEQPKEAAQVLENVCAGMGARLHISRPGEYGGIKILLLGEHQLINAALAVKTAEVLRGKGFGIPPSAVEKGLITTRWPGRFEVFGTEPPVIIDGAHNPQGASALASALKLYYPGKRILFVMGALSDKDYPKMLDEVTPLASRFITVAPNSPRALPASALAEEIRARGALAESAGTVEGAVKNAVSRAAPEEAVCCFGSLYFIGEARTVLLNMNKNNEKRGRPHEKA